MQEESVRASEGGDMRRESDMGGERDDEKPEGWSGRKEGPSGKLIVAGIAAVLLIVFVLQNTTHSNITFLFWDGDLSLWVLIAVSAFLGLVIGWFLGRSSGRRAAIRKLD
jgi:uncharacterized integral membrane protein